jgi:methylamine dehydrogenase heavy chain
MDQLAAGALSPTSSVKFRALGVGLTALLAVTVAAGAAASASAAAGAADAAAAFPTPLAAETIPNVRSLPASYPDTWAFFNFSSDRIELRNVGGDGREVEGDLQARDSAMLLISSTRPELYVADTVWSRFTRGVRTDYITVYDTKTLDPIGEIVLPTKRGLITAMEGMFAFTDHERLALVFNFTPASSVTVVDLVKRKVLGEVEIPGCSLVYPTVPRGFSTLCASGTLLTVLLGEDGKVTGRSESKAFNRIDTDPLFTWSATLGAVRYFPTMLGHVQPIESSGETVTVLPQWSLVSAEDEAANWRPSGWQPIAGDAVGSLYVLMQSDAREGSYKDPGSEVWVFDTRTKTRTKRLRLARPGSSIALTHAREPLLLVQGGERLDVYDPQTGGLVRSLNMTGFRTRMTIQPVPGDNAWAK